MVQIIVLEEARRRLGEDVVVCLELDPILTKKVEDGKEAELWCFDPATGRSGRGDGKFFDGRYVDRGGWGQLVLYEEPNLSQPEDGSSRVVGHVIVEWNHQHGQIKVRVRKAKGLNGEMLELKPSSISKGELAEKGLEPVGYIESNPQRIVGMIAVYSVEVNAIPEAELMTPAEFRKQSTDGRSLAALAKVLWW